MDMEINNSDLDTDSDTDDEPFYFESDHLALRGNSDYTAILRTLNILEAQRIQATRDLDKLGELKNAALENPGQFLKNLTTNEDFSMPCPINIAEIPKIDFQKYDLKLSNFDGTHCSADIKKENPQEFLQENQIKRESQKNHWTSVEQRRLEELLEKYPPETFEMRRFAKISNELGTRTTKQVASRVQKYFKKLHSAGMPIPGRIPKTQRNTSYKAFRHNKNAFRPSTFFPDHYVPVKMPEDDCGDMNMDIPSINLPSTSNSVKSFDKIANSDEQQKFISVDNESDASINDDTIDLKKKKQILKLIERVKKDKEKDCDNNRPQSTHLGYKCNHCSEEPINGTRWHCKTCIDESIDFCSDCLVSQLLSDAQHSIDHSFSGLRVKIVPEPNNYDSDSSNSSNNEEIKLNMFTNYDKDYMISKFSKDDDYNYLDPNFLV